jgi:hypothetical protein
VDVGSEADGQSCSTISGSAIYAAGAAAGAGRGTFTFDHNIVYWRHGPLIAGGTSRGRLSHLDARCYILYGETLMKYNKECLNDSTADG